MADLRVTASDKSIASQILSSFMGEGDDRQSIDPTKISWTDDIGECEPFNKLVKQITGESPEHIANKLPFNTYDRFDASKLEHDFTLTTIHKDATNAATAIKEYLPLLSLAGSCDSLQSFLLMLYDNTGEDISEGLIQLETNLKGDVIKLAERVQSQKDIKNIIRASSGLKSLKQLGRSAKSQDATIEIVRATRGRTRITPLSETERRPVVPPVKKLPNVQFITSPYGPRQLPGKPWKFHYGLDIRSMRQQKGKGYVKQWELQHLVAMEPFKVLRIGTDGGNNDYIVFKPLWTTLYDEIKYIHIDVDKSIKVNDILKAGQFVGTTQTKGSSAAHHLHLETWKNGKPIDPLDYLELNHIKYRMVGRVPSYITKPDIIYKTKDPTSEFRQQFEDKIEYIRNTMHDMIAKVYVRVTSSIYWYYVNNIKGKVEDLKINWQPGTNVSVPIEGENAPVVQSIGGRLVQVTLSLKEQSPVDIANIALMFKVSNNQDTVASMLSLARSTFNAVPAKVRQEYLQRYARAEQIERVLKNISGGPQKIHLDEPVVIANDVLNSLGLRTFQPVSLEVRTVSGAAHAYDVLLTLNYVNLSNRNTMALKKSRYGGNIPILPVTSRLFKDKSGMGTGKAPLDGDHDLYGLLSRVSIKHGMTELLPLYVISKIYKCYKAIRRAGEEYIKNNPGQKASIDLSKPEYLLRTLVSDEASYNLFMSTLSPGRTKGMTPSGLYGQIMEGATGFFSAAVGGLFGNQAVKMVAAKSISKGFGKWGAIAMGSFYITSLCSRFIFGLGGRKSESTDANTLYINIPSVMPVMIWSMISEFIEHLKINKTDEFILDIADTVLEMLKDSNTQDIDSRDRRLIFPDVIEICGVPGKDPYDLQSMHLSIVLSSTHGEQHVKGFIYDSSIQAGLAANRQVLVDFQRKMLTETAKNAGKADHSKDVGNKIYAYATAEINRVAIDAVIAISHMSNPLGSNITGKIGTFYNTASELRSSGASRRHCIEILTSIITSSLLDTLANSFLVKEGKAAEYSARGEATTTLQQVTGSTTPDEIKDSISRQITVDMTKSLSSARQVISNRNMNSGLLSGVFADNSFGGSNNLRRGYCQALSNVFSLCHYIAIDSREGKKINKEYPDEGKIAAILGKIDQSLFNIMLEESAIVHDYITNILLNMAPSLAVDAAAAFASGGWSVALKAMSWLYVIAEGASFAAYLIGDKAVQIAVGYGSYFALSKWLAGRIAESMNRSQLIEACYLTDIWMPAAMEFDSDARDTLGTSYMDFPVIQSGGSPMPPDFYVYKIGLFEGVYEDMKDMMKEMTQNVSDRFGDIDGSDISKMRYQLKEDIGQARIRNVKLLEDVLTRAVVSNLPSKEYHTTYLKELGKCGDMINIAVYGDKDVAKKIGGIANTTYGSTKSSLSGEQSIITITFGTDTVTVSVSDTFKKITSKDEFVDAMQKRGTIITRTTEAANSCKVASVRTYVRSFLFVAIQSILSFVDRQRSITGDAIDQLAIAPGTLGNLLLLKSIVGSNMRAIGKPGLAYFTSQLNRIGRDSLRRASSLQTQYIFPTVKLYFIEEDEENFYLFDDLYSYASIIKMSIYRDKYSPMQTAQIQVTNLYGVLNDVMADERNMEGNFIKGPDENAAINAIMLKPGCKIKIQVGNTPILTEDDTVFTGRISSVDFNAVTSIEATSHGDMFLEDLTRDTIKVYGTKLPGNIVGKIVSKLRRLFIRQGFGDYLTPITKIKHTISYVLNDVVQSSERLTDFSIRAPVEVDDPQLTSTSATIMNAISKHFYSVSAEGLIDLVGGVKLDVHNNEQLFENIHIRGDLIESSWLGAGTLLSEGFWVSRNEAAWDILSEINLLLPNHCVSVRPYDTRSTLVWTDREGYYRYRRSIDSDSIMCNAAISKILPLTRDTKYKLVQVLSIVTNGLRSSNQNIRSGAIALLTNLAYQSQKVYAGFMFNAPSKMRAQLSDPDIITSESSSDMVTKALRWIPISMLSHLNSIGKDLGEIYEDMADKSESNMFKDNGLVKLPIKDISDDIDKNSIYFPRLVRKSNETAAVYLLSLNFAAENMLNFFADMTLSRSTSHKRVSDFHLKMSGRDIVKNDIQLMEPYNTVKLSYPKANVEDPESLADAALIGEAGKANEIMVPIHYKLKPWSQKVYQTHFKNANAFPTARTQAISTASSSILTNLMSQTYGGSITLLGDSRLCEHDRMFIWDEVRDLFGIVGIKSHTLIISPEEGFLSVVEPEMIVRNDSKFQHTVYDSLISYADMVFDTLLVVGAVTAAFLGVRKMRRTLRIRNQAGIASARLVSKYARGLAKSLDNLAERIPFMKLAGRSVFSWFNKLNGGLIAKNVATAYGKMSGILGKTFSDPDFVDPVISTIQNTIRSMKMHHTQEAMRAAVKGSLSDKHLRGIIKTAFDGTLDVLSKARTTGTTVRQFGFADIYMNKIVTSISAHISSSTKGVSVKAKSAIMRKIRQTLRQQIDIRVSNPDLNPFEIDGIIGLDKRIAKGLEEIAKARAECLQYIKGLKPGDLEYPKGWGRRIMKKLHGETPQQFMERLGKGMMDGYKDDILIGGRRFWRGLKRNAKVILNAAWIIPSVSSVYGVGKQFFELKFLTEYTADKIVLAPLMFRGEPFVAGLTGVDKKDGEDAGFTDIMKARFQTTFEGLTHVLTDPYSEAVHRLSTEMTKIDNMKRRQ